MAEIAVLSGSAVVLARSAASPARRAAGLTQIKGTAEAADRLAGNKHHGPF